MIFYNPIEIEIDLTRNCNQNCIHCWNNSSKSLFIPLEKVKEIISEFRYYGGQKLKITGGEPLVYDGLEKFLEFSQRYGIRKFN